MSSLEVAVGVTTWAVVGYFVVANTSQTILLLSAVVDMVAHRRRGWAGGAHRLLSSPLAPRISVLAPAYNEAATIESSVRALLTLRYPNLEVVVVNDGSRDDTLEVLRTRFGLRAVPPLAGGRIATAPILGLHRSTQHRGLVVVDKVNAGKADSLNAALNVASGDLVCAIDADTLIEPDAFLRIVHPFLAHDDTVAAGATIRVVNECAVRDGRVVNVRAPRRWLAGVQALEYLRAFLFGRLGWNRLGGNVIISGAFGMFRRGAVLAVGGYRRDTVGEDMDLVVRLRHAAATNGSRARVVFVPDPIAWTEVPESLRVLGRQRDRWQRGLADVLWIHRSMVLNPRFGALGLVVLPYYLVVELCAPLLEALGLVLVAAGLAGGFIDPSLALLFFLVSYGWGLLLSLAALGLHQATAERAFPASDLPVLLGWIVVEALGYRQLTVLWRLRGMWRYVRGRSDWGAMSRLGFSEAEEERVTSADLSRAQHSPGERDATWRL